MSSSVRSRSRVYTWDMAGAAKSLDLRLVVVAPCTVRTFASHDNACSEMAKKLLKIGAFPKDRTVLHNDSARKQRSESDRTCAALPLR